VGRIHNRRPDRTLNEQTFDVGELQLQAIVRILRVEVQAAHASSVGRRIDRTDVRVDDVSVLVDELDTGSPKVFRNEGAELALLRGRDLNAAVPELGSESSDIEPAPRYLDCKTCGDCWRRDKVNPVPPG